MEFLASIMFMAGIAVLLFRLLKKDTAIAEAETQERYMSILRKDLSSDGLDDIDAEVPKEKKGRRALKLNNSPLVNDVSKRLASSQHLRSGEGLTMMEKLNEQLILAGIRDQMTPFDAFGAAIVIWSMGVILPTLTYIFLGLPKLLFIGCFVVGIWYPFGKLKNLIAARQDSLKMELPIFIQQLSMALSSGMITLDDAIKRVVANAQLDPYDSELAREFGRAHTEYTLTGRDREEALRGVSRRTQVVSVENLVEAIIQGLRTGSEMSRILDEYAEQSREMWRQDVRAFKAKKEPHVTIGLIITMFGGFFLLATPMMINLIMTINNL